MPPKKRRQCADTINYLKRKDIATESRSEFQDEGSGEARDEGGMGSGEVRDEGGTGSGEVRDEGGMGSGEASEPGSYSNEDEEIVTKRRKLSEISAMADEPLQEWLDNVPRDDLAHGFATILKTSYCIWPQEN